MASDKQKSLVGEAVRIELRKEAGESEWVPRFEADRADVALYGLQVLIEEFCSITGLTLERALALLTARMLSD